MAGEGDVADNETEVAIFSFYPISTLIFWVLSSDHFIMPFSFTLLASQCFCSLQGSANPISRRNSKRAAKRQPRGDDKDGDGEGDDVSGEQQSFGIYFPSFFFCSLGFLYGTHTCLIFSQPLMLVNFFLTQLQGGERFLLVKLQRRKVRAEAVSKGVDATSSAAAAEVT